MPILRAGHWTASALVALATTATAAAAPPGPVTVSPGGTDSVAAAASDCPTFSWTAAPGALAYELVVVEASQGGPLDAAPVLRADVPAGATSWTPAAEGRLTAGTAYAWSVRAVGPAGAGFWSDPRLFRVPRPEVGREAVVALLREAVTDEWIREELRSLLSEAEGRGQGSESPPTAAAAAPPPPASAPAPKAAPSPRLQVKGDAVVSGDYYYTLSRAIDYAVPVPAFQLMESDEDDVWDLYPGGYGRVYGTPIYRVNLMAPLHLPEGATVNVLRCLYYDALEVGEPDDDDLMVHMELRRRGVFLHLDEVMATVSFTSAGSTNSVRTVATTTIEDPLVDNFQFQYYLTGHFEAEGNYDDLRFYGCAIELLSDRASGY